VTLARFAARIVATAACVLLAAGCNDTSTTGPSSTAPFSKLDLRLGDGAEAVAGNALTVSYSGWLYDPTKTDLKGLLFDTSLNSEFPFTFTLGFQQVIQGWDEGLVGMKVGGIRKLVIPSTLAYGGIRNQSIPPFATLVFEVELLDLQVPAQAQK
jgi:FKBP-type peptidyl-prolyl cis-trans isomerase FkpA